MYQRKLIVAFSIFLALIVLQSAATLWAFQTLNYHTERSRAAQQMLTHIVHFRADAKRLQVWLADFIIAEKRDTVLRDELFERMSDHLQHVDQLNQQVFENSQYNSDPSFSQGVAQKSVFLHANMTALKQALQTREINQLHSDSERWQTLVSLVDKFQGSDIASVVHDLIILHTDKSFQAENDAAAMARFLFTTLIIISLFSLLLFIVMSLYLTRHFSQSLARLTQGAERIEASDFSHKIPEVGSKEFVHLAHAFNQMSESLEHSVRQQKLLQNATENKVNERTAQLQHVVNQLHDAEIRQKGFIAEVTHELRTPTTIIMGEAELALRTKGKDPSLLNASFERIIECCNSLKSRIDDLIMLSKGQHALVSVTLKPASPAEIYQQLIQQTTLQATHYPAQLDYSQAFKSSDFDLSRSTLLVDCQKLDLAFRILIENAIQYQKTTPYLKIGYQVDNTSITYKIIDKGIGLTEDEHSILFKRHARGARAKLLRPKGLGIGLCIAKSIIDAHDGTLSVEQNPPQGAIAQITLPLFDLENE
jgi:two-component system OmpR family sensor kinase